MRRVGKGSGKWKIFLVKQDHDEGHIGSSTSTAMLSTSTSTNKKSYSYSGAARYSYSYSTVVTTRLFPRKISIDRYLFIGLGQKQLHSA